jgi:hypothetical protein
VRSGPGEGRTILLLHIISVRPSKQPLMVRTFLEVYMDLGSYFLFLQEQIKDIIIRPTGRPNRTSLLLECHRKAINQNHFGSSAMHSTKA